MYWPLQQQGSSGETVRTVQYLLNAQGANLTVDGIFGPLTAAAVTTFQSDNGLTADGAVGDQTWPALLVQVSTGSTGDAVSAVQSQIQSRSGWLTVNGTFDANTANAVQWFQTPLGLTADGVINWYTWHALVGRALTATGGQDAASALFQAWSNNDQRKAENYATPGALAALFARAWNASDGWTFASSGGAAGHFICTWNGAGGKTLTFEGNDNTGAPFYYVQNVTFS
jgi:peptidoglycan hydrolase-like protein with peptidoglycan-binding domain